MTFERPPSLAQHFEAPDGFDAVFGRLCGYSADSAFLDDALERFTRQIRTQRSYDGRIWLAMMLDPGAPQIPFADAPGTAHLQMLADTDRPFALLHAKVALLGFRSSTTPGRWRVRLLVCTGNWTRQTLEESIDLVWCIEVDSETLTSGGSEVKEACADIAAANSLFSWLTTRFDTRLLEASRGRLAESLQAATDFDRCLARCTEVADKQPARFFDNRERSLIEQLPERIKAATTSVRRNYLAMGSGFYEAPSNRCVSSTPRLPAVPIEIRDVLWNAGLLTSTAEIDLFVNPEGCQAIAGGLQALNEEGITVRPAGVPSLVYGENAVRSLHAKFLYGANYRSNTAYCSSPWLYIGSGNLTAPGFTLAAGFNRGNLEAGVVFAPRGMAWWKKAGVGECDVLTNWLPIHWESDCNTIEELKAGDDFPDRSADQVAAPLAWLDWKPLTGGGELVAPEKCVAGVDVLGDGSTTCHRTPNGFLWSGPRPREVMLRWYEDDERALQCLVPVIDELGRIAASPLPEISIEDAWWQLAEFPLPPVIDDDLEYPDDVENEDKYPNGESCDNRSNDRGPPSSYPIRRMMELIEQIAAKQTALCESEWSAWCVRLEQTLLQAANSPAVKYFADLKLNPLSPLRAPPFRPGFAESAANKYGREYEAMLDRIEQAWGVAQLTSIG
ncbi:hypothetical protein LRB11_16000 [Ectothiorhodospira haloalkaliphila]|uniref:hypothetical protein n=1 Tax=Ectothiorhodospira haloalkaliphila TaxID=421628 RepID=UPI001EE8EEF1|nr:hypothetical protein [Ectothiorhodospira haloalkaliphila]MCG5526414.1 hypothetical protein [Ectothiorhodospira haloalkaliphila]